MFEIIPAAFWLLALLQVGIAIARSSAMGNSLVSLQGGVLLFLTQQKNHCKAHA